MAVVAVVGGQWGDEGKGKIVDLLGEQCQYVVRYNGGNNAGHTVMNQFGNFAMHTVPSGIFSPDTVCVVGNGVVVNPRAILEELAGVAASGARLGRLVISDRAHVVMPYHLKLDQLEEACRGSGSIGTTGRGIGPAYSDKYNRVGIRMGDLVDEDLFRSRLAATIATKNRVLACLYGADPLSYEQVLEEYQGYARQLAPYVGDAGALLQSAASRGENILLEGAQGSMLDVDFGTYPYVTSSSVVAGGGFVGSGIPPRYAVHVLGIYKAYCSRVGAGPFPTELFDDTASHIREVGHEYGTTTGRPRRIGWFDAVAGRFAADLNGLASIALTRLDVL
ncbi:MAG: adenylosuccinate synthase, partial [Chloroflexota bacterium]